MARKKIVVQREKVKPLKKKRKLSEEHKEKLRARLAEMRAKRKPAEYKNIHPTVLATANITVNIDSGSPKAFKIIPE